MRVIVKVTSVFILVFMFAFTAAAFAAGAATPDDGSLLELLRPVYDAFASGRYLYAGMLSLVLVVAVLKRYAPEKYGIRAFVHGDAGGALLTLLAAFGGAMATSLAAGAGASWMMVKTATMIAIGAAGGYSLIKKLIVEPILKPLAAKAPAWAQPIFSLVFWIFDKPTPVEKAEADGQAAVDAHPPTGVDGAAGKPTEIP
jgi:hypothetical protein